MPENVKIVQIRDVPTDAVEVLQARAVNEGMSLTAYLRNQLIAMASRPTMAEVFAQASRRSWGVNRDTIVRTIREIRDDEE